MQRLFDPFDILGSFAEVNASWARHASEYRRRLDSLGNALVRINSQVQAQVGRLLECETPKDSEARNAFILECSRTASNAMREFHRAIGQWMQETIATAPELPPQARTRARFWTEQLWKMTAPANFFWTNPNAVRRFLDSGGESLQTGFANWLEDFSRGDNLIKLTDENAFEVGRNLAATPGRVVYRNALFELIQYAPSTERTWRIPIVLIQPWINKYYIFDLSADNSFVKYLVAQGFTVFIMSWKNPTSGMRHVSFADYMLRGAYKAVAVAARIGGADRVHAAGYCIGGTVLAALMAWLNRSQPEEGPVVDWTLFATLVDYASAGNMAMLISESSIQAIEHLMEQSGYLDAMHLGMAFRLLNSEGLIWRCLIHNYLCGGTPPKSDMLFWNGDSTRLPAAMCSFYLREFYVHNRLSQKDGLVLGGRPIDLERIRQPLYAVGAEQDHICPWQGTFQTGRRVGGPVKYVLSADGHVTGIVNPPSPHSRKKYRAAGLESRQTAPEEWANAQAVRRGSWWPDWVQWLQPRSGGLGPPPPMGGGFYPVLEPAPGSYVFER